MEDSQDKDDALSCGKLIGQQVDSRRQARGESMGWSGDR